LVKIVTNTVLCTVAIYSQKADINFGLAFVFSLAVTVILSAVNSMVFFGESLNLADLVGVFVISLGLVFITMGAAAHEA
jgi:drug/metabolite transporter (DMT)-like permease